MKVHSQHITATDEVLAGMLTENTGRHMLDSGGHYGRHWEKNAGTTAAGFAQSEPVTVDRFGVTLNVFHYLRDRLEYSAGIQELFNEYASANPDEGWLSLAEEFPNVHGFDEPNTFNTYNFETLLSQTVQGVTFKVGDECYALIQIHGGCDVRGGYTAPKAFKVTTWDMPEAFYWDAADFFAHCPTDEEHGFNVRGSEVIDWHGGWAKGLELEFTDDGLKCPHCGTFMLVGGCEPC